jgi:hypothetical protein
MSCILADRYPRFGESSAASFKVDERGNRFFRQVDTCLPNTRHDIVEDGNLIQYFES